MTDATRRSRVYVAAVVVLCLVGTALYVLPAYAQTLAAPRFIQLCHGTVAGNFCDTDIAVNAPGDEHELTARVTDRDGLPVPGVSVQFRETGPAIFTPQGGSTVTVVTDANGIARVLLTSDVEGQSTIVAEITAPRGAGPIDDECEQPAGSGGQPAAGNCISEALTKIWDPTPGPNLLARNIQLCHGTVAGTSCDTNIAFNEPGTEHELTARVTDRDGVPVPGVSVQFRETGPGIFTPQGGSTATVVTDANGLARVLLTSDVQGQSTIVAEIMASRGPGPTDDECEQPGIDGERAAGNCISQALMKGWGDTTRHERRVGIRFDHRMGNRLVVFGRLRLAESSFTECIAQQWVIVQRRVDGQWETKRRTNTNLRGRYAVELLDHAARYRVLAPRTEILSVGLTHLDVCSRAVGVKRHRHR